MLTASAEMGMVLSAIPIGEYDKRLVILTKERGKITAFAKGARKPNSAFLACSQPFSFGEFMLYEGRNSYTLQSVNITNYFEELRKDLELAYYGLYFCELVDYFCHENEDGTENLKLLYQSLRALNQQSLDNRLVRTVFELKLFVFQGIAPEMFQCVSCGKKEHMVMFHSDAGGVKCMDCKDTNGYSIRISNSTIYTMQYIITSTIEKLYTFTVKDQVLFELIQCMDSYRKCHVDRKMKTLEFINKLL